MLLHDSYFHSSKKLINTTHHGTIVIAYSPLFHSTLTLLISVFGLLLNLLCSIKLWSILSQNRQRKPQKPQEQESQESAHVLSHNKYRFLLVLTSNDCLLCFSSIISCLDEKYFFQSFLARYHLCAAHILLWKFTLHFIPLLTIVILCRYHYISHKTFLVRTTSQSTLNQLLCTDLNILIAFVLALAWSVDGLWLWGVANIEDFIKRPLASNAKQIYSNKTIEMINTSSTNATDMNTTLLDFSPTLGRREEQNEESLYLPEQKTICYLQTNYNFQFSVRLIHLIEADFLLLLSLHLIGLLLAIILHIRLCCCVLMKEVTSAFNHERQLCIYILYIFLLITLTSLPFYLYRTIDIIFETHLTSINSDFLNSHTFAQILLLGTCFKPFLVFILFFPPSILFYLKCYLQCYPPATSPVVDQDEEMLTVSNDRNQQQESNNRSQHHRYSLFVHSPRDLKFHSRSRTRSNPHFPRNSYRHDSFVKPEQLTSLLKSDSVILGEESKIISA